MDKFKKQFPGLKPSVDRGGKAMGDAPPGDGGSSNGEMPATPPDHNSFQQKKAMFAARLNQDKYSSQMSSSRMSKRSQMMTHSHSVSSEVKSSSEVTSNSTTISAARRPSIDSSPIVQFPDTPSDSLDVVPFPATVTSGGPVKCGSNPTVCNGTGAIQKFEQKRMTSSHKKIMTSDGFSHEEGRQSNAEMRRVQAGDVSYQHATAQQEMQQKTEVDGLTAEKTAARTLEHRQLTAGDVSHQERKMAATGKLKLSTDAWSAERVAAAASQDKNTVNNQTGAVMHKESHKAATTGSKLTINSSGISSAHMSIAGQSSKMVNGTMVNESFAKSGPVDMPDLFNDLDKLSRSLNSVDVQTAMMKCSSVMSRCIEQLGDVDASDQSDMLNNMNDLIKRAWSIPQHGQELGSSLCDVLRNNGGLDILIQSCSSDDQEVQFSGAQVLEQCLTTDNRGYVIENGLEKVVNVACGYTAKANRECDNSHSRVGTGILEHLFKHSEVTCSDVIRLGGLDALVLECRRNDVETLRHCASALANLSLYGGSENQQAMVKKKVAHWLFPLAFHTDDNIKYYACLAIAALVANKEIEAEVLKSEALKLIEPFITNHNPMEFAQSTVALVHGQSKSWLQKLVPVLRSKREEARNLAAFHFAMEAGIKKNSGLSDMFREIGAIEPLKEVARSPSDIASRYAREALRLIGEEVPHKLSQQVPLWSVEDVLEWVKQIGFLDMREAFYRSRVDGDLLFQLDEQMLRDDLGITNGILRKRFLRELSSLKVMADYSSCDNTDLNGWLQRLHPQFSVYTYKMLQCGVNRDTLRLLVEDPMLLSECGVYNTIHRIRLLDEVRAVQEKSFCNSEDSLDKNLDVFISYRRSNGSQLASLLKVHLEVRGFTVFLDVSGLEAGKFDKGLMQNIRQARHFLLVLTPNALDRCLNDNESRDWVHQEIVCALQSKCNIVPITDNFHWPDSDELPEDMKAISFFNAVKWIHDYQEACVDKLERFIRAELNVRTDGAFVHGTLTPRYHRTQSNESGKGSSCSDTLNNKD